MKKTPVFINDAAQIPKTVVDTVLLNKDGGTTQDSKVAVAKKVSVKASTQYYIRVNNVGVRTTLLADPLTEKAVNYDTISDGVPNFPLTAVTAKVFDHYVRYLTTRNPRDLTLAERERSNG